MGKSKNYRAPQRLEAEELKGVMSKSILQFMEVSAWRGEGPITVAGTFEGLMWPAGAPDLTKDSSECILYANCRGGELSVEASLSAILAAQNIAGDLEKEAVIGCSLDLETAFIGDAGLERLARGLD